MSIHGLEISDATVHSRCRTQMPKYLDDYEVDYVPEQPSAHKPSDHSNVGEQPIGATGGPLPLHSTLVAGIDHFPAYGGNAHFSPEALEMRLKDLEKENRQLRRDLSEHSAAHTSRSLSPSQPFHSLRHLTCNMENRISTSPSHHRVTSTRDQSDPRYEGERSVKHSKDKLHSERQCDRIDEIIHELQRMKAGSKQSDQFRHRQSVQYHPRGRSMLMKAIITQDIHPHTITALPPGSRDHSCLIILHCQSVKRTLIVVQPLPFLTSPKRIHVSSPG